MNFLLKIVEGPNKGAEIALVNGIVVTLGKGDDCDIVLADATLPDKPLTIEAAADGVSVGGEPLEQFTVKTAGATSFAIGPADAPWGELKWPSREPAGEEGGPDASPEAERGEGGEAPETKEPAHGEEEASKPRRRGCLACLLALAAVLAILAALAWLFRGQVLPRAEKVWNRIAGESGCGAPGVPADGAVAHVQAADIRSIAVKYGLSVTNRADATLVTGNLRTRAERLSATAEAYAVQPGVDLDLSDDESFRTAAEDALFTLTEGALKVASATNRALSVVGMSPSAAALQRTLAALSSDIPKLNSVDVSGVSFGKVPVIEESDGDAGAAAPAAPRLPVLAPRKVAAAPSFPVCGILTTPYPCLVLRNGTRILEGASLDGSVIVEIGSDSVVVTNAAGRFEWRP